MTLRAAAPQFSPDLPADVGHASIVREEALDWLGRSFPGVHSFTPSAVLRMVGESKRRDLIIRLRKPPLGEEPLLGEEKELSLPVAADVLTVLFLRARGVRFGEAMKAVRGERGTTRSPQPRYGGVWSRLIVTALDRLRRRVPPRLLGAAVAGLLEDVGDHPNALIVVKLHGLGDGGGAPEGAAPASHDDVYRTILERPAPACAVVAPSREVLFLGSDRLPAWSEVTSRHFVRLMVRTEVDLYEVLLGTIRPVSVRLDEQTKAFVGRILDIVFVRFEEFHRDQSADRVEAAVQPEPGSADDLQLWLITRFIDALYPGSLSEVNETSQSSAGERVLASSAAKPWEPSRWDPPRGLDMLSGYASSVGVPLVVEKVQHPLTLLIQSVESELRYLRTGAQGEQQSEYSALALPIGSLSGASIGSLYILMPELRAGRVRTEVRVPWRKSPFTVRLTRP